MIYQKIKRLLPSYLNIGIELLLVDVAINSELLFCLTILMISVYEASNPCHALYSEVLLPLAVALPN